MTDASRNALNIYSALFGAGIHRRQGYGGQNSGPTPMEIGNFEKRDEDLKRNACFKCHKVGCRPWKFVKNGQKQASITNTRMNDGAESAGHQSEN